MRILLCNYEYPPLGGGGGVATALLAEELAKRHAVTVLTSQGFDLPREHREADVRVIRVPVHFRRQAAVASFASMLAFLPQGIRAGRQLLARESFDVINTHFVLPTGPVGDALARAGRIPNVLSLHGGDLYDPSKVTSPHRHPVLRAWIRHLLRSADAVVGQSTNTLANMQQYYTPEIGGTRIPLGIRKPAARVAARAGYGLAAEDVLLITVGRLVRRKAVHELVQVLDALRPAPARLLIVGAGPQEAALRREVARRGLQAQVRFMGYVGEREKLDLLAMSDIYVSTAQHEGFGLTFLEAMACGLPIVCYDNGGQTDFLVDQETGFVVQLGDVDLFALRCQQLLAQPARRRDMAAENQRRVEAFYIDRCAASYERLFQSVVAGAHNPIVRSHPTWRPA